MVGRRGTPSAPGTSVAGQMLYAVEHRLRTDGYSEEEIAAALAYRHRHHEAVRTGQAWETLQAATRQAQGARWLRSTESFGAIQEKQEKFGTRQAQDARRLPHTGRSPAAFEALRQWRAVLDWDPAPVLEQVGCPVLANFGARDPLVPAEQSAAVWDYSLRRAGNQDYTVKVYPEGNHTLIRTDASGRHGEEFVPKYLETTIAWLRQRLDIATRL